MKEHYHKFPSIEDLSILSLMIPEYEGGNEYLISEQWNNRLSLLQNFFIKLQKKSDWQIFIKSFSSNKEALCDDLFLLDDPRSEIYTAVSAVLSHPQIMTEFLATIDEVSKFERAKILGFARGNNNTIENIDVLLIGGSGLHGTISSVEIQANNPMLNILSIDAANLRGGIFRSYANTIHEEVGIYDINSRQNQPAKFNKNDIQPNSPAHLEGITGETYPAQNMLGATIAVNGFLTAPALLEAFVTKVVELNNNCIEITFTHNNETFKVISKKVIISTGVPKTFIPNGNSIAEKNIIKESEQETSDILNDLNENIPTFIRGENFFKILSKKKGELLNSFSQKRIVVIGQGDTAQGILKLLCGYGRKEMYEGYVSQFGRPKITWIISNKDNIPLRPQHEVLRKEIKEDNGLIETIEGRASTLGKTINNRGVVRFSHGGEVNNIVGDFFIYCTGPKNYITEFPLIKDNNLKYVSEHKSNVILGRGNSNIYIVGPAANIPLTKQEVLENPLFSKMKTPPISMRRLGFRTRKLARAISIQIKNDN